MRFTVLPGCELPACLQYDVINEKIGMLFTRLKFVISSAGEKCNMPEEKAVRGIRGATTAGENVPAEIYSATKDLLAEMIEANSVDLKDICAVLFSATPDLNCAFPARAAREMGWLDVPLFCHVEIDVPDSIPRCIRVLVLVNTTVKQDQVKHVYLKETVKLREL
jgi:chorismate mutase